MKIGFCFVKISMLFYEVFLFDYICRFDRSEIWIVYFIILLLYI